MTVEEGIADGVDEVRKAVRYQIAHGAKLIAGEGAIANGKACIQVHGGMGFTWEFDCHLYYRRSNALALSLGSLSYWEDTLIERMRKKNAA